MFHRDELDTKNIIDIIESVDDTLQYSSIELFKKAMTSVGFVVRKLKAYNNFSCYSCKGKINQQSIHLDIYQRTNNDVVCVRGKRYFIEILASKRAKRLDHRENDLPSSIMYDEQNGKVTDLRYYVSNQEYRKEKNPVHIRYTYNQDNEVLTTYFKFTCERYLDNFINLSLYEVIYKNNLIIDGAVCYNNELLSIVTLSMILPDVKMADLSDLFNLKNIVTEEHLKLIEMFNI